MIGAFIENNQTWLMEVDGKHIPHTSEIESYFRKNYIGWLVNTENTIRHIGEFPIDKFYLKRSKNSQYEEISRENAMKLYELVRQKEEEQRKAKQGTSK